MRAGVPVRTTVIWGGLVLATCATWWLAAGHPAARQSLRTSVALAIVIAFLKTYFVGAEFMELRGAPRALHAAFTAWVVVVAATTTTLYLV
jgi:cytochrome c oxidase subunit IV